MATYNLTNATLDNLRASANMAGNLDLPQKASFALLKNVNEINRHLKDYDAQVGDMVREFALLDEEGNPQTTPQERGRVSVKLDPDRISEFAAKRAELDEFICENVTIHMVSDSAFSGEGTLKPSELGLIAWMIDGLSTLESAK